jgi:ribosomal protein S18 acetylase RimI-like enzyme
MSSTVCVKLQSAIASRLESMRVIESANINLRPEPAETIIVRPGGYSDLVQTVQVHKVAFPTSFLTALGDRFLYELYRGFLRDESSIYLVAEEKGRQRGLVVGTTEPRSFFKRLLVRRWSSFLCAGFTALLRNPVRVAQRFLFALVYRGETPPGLDEATLLSSIGVAPAHGGRGFGAVLVERFCEEAASRGSRSVYLLTDSGGNDRVNHFYLKCGFALDSRVERQERRIMNRYIRPIATAVAAKSDLDQRGHSQSLTPVTIKQAE